MLPEIEGKKHKHETNCSQIFVAMNRKIRESMPFRRDCREETGLSGWFPWDTRTHKAISFPYVLMRVDSREAFI
jgi:hypothetical protein